MATIPKIKKRKGYAMQMFSNINIVLVSLSEQIFDIKIIRLLVLVIINFFSYNISDYPPLVAGR